MTTKPEPYPHPVRIGDKTFKFRTVPYGTKTIVQTGEIKNVKFSHLSEWMQATWGKECALPDHLKDVDIRSLSLGIKTTRSGGSQTREFTFRASFSFRADIGTSVHITSLHVHYRSTKEFTLEVMLSLPVKVGPKKPLMKFTGMLSKKADSWVIDAAWSLPAGQEGVRLTEVASAFNLTR
ncbi:hypothetical protein [Streptomyces sp. NPDC021096]|uniref:hypothetical protein n=1 Tax=Streptomyces sp. NPDC021096 TaxID=3154792 RepID=UPI00340D60DA